VADEVEPAALHAELAASDPPMVVDVREPWEWDVAHLSQATLVPLGELGSRLAELPRHRPLVTLCHKGVRSAKAAALLRRAGFASVRSLAGGIEAWGRDVDPSLPKY
jgi:adenylyltransferase/sulfurtransferase